MTEYGSGADKSADWLAQAAAESGIEISIPAAPDLPFWLVWVWEGFIALSGSRTIGVSGPNKISFLDIKAYLDLLEIRSALMRQDFLYYITRLDDKFFEMYQKRAPK